MGGRELSAYIGVDIGGTKISVVKGDDNGVVQSKVKFLNDRSPSEIIERILCEVENLLPATAVGVSCGGPLDDKRGVILSPPNLPKWDNVPIVKLLEERTHIPVFLQNDANACALAEWKLGAGRGSENMIFLTFGTGMGAGLILGGRLYSGTCGNAGEVGHIRLGNSGPEGYGKVGSFEGFASGGGIANAAKAVAKELLKRNEKCAFCSGLDFVDSITAESVAQAARDGDKYALDVYRDCGRMLGRGVSTLIDVLNPECVVIGSIYARALDLLQRYMLEKLEKETLSASLAACRILPATLGESLGDVAALMVAANGMTNGR